MAPSLEIAIPSATVSSTPKPYTIYKVSLKQPLRTYMLEKRYTDFVALHSALQAQCGTEPPAPLPQKSWFKSTVNDATLTEKRRRGLEEYLTAVNENVDPSWRNTIAWKNFLKLPAKAGGSGSTSLAGSAASSNLQGGRQTEKPREDAVTDASAWLDRQRELKSHLRDARVQLTRRDQADSAQRQHQASADAKACMVRATADLRALEAGLKGVTGLGPGELRRRRDELSKARKELNALDVSFNNFSARREDGGGGGAQAQASGLERDSLMASAEGGAGPTAATGRRVLGGPLRETDKTRELDNEGVLQLQKQIMQQQDVDVGDLTKVVQRMREMGVQINDELEIQNEMLGLLSQDAERVEGKIGVAKKRLGKIK